MCVNFRCERATSDFEFGAPPGFTGSPSLGVSLRVVLVELNCLRSW